MEQDPPAESVAGRRLRCQRGIGIVAVPPGMVLVDGSVRA